MKEKIRVLRVRADAPEYDDGPKILHGADMRSFLVFPQEGWEYREEVS